MAREHDPTITVIQQELFDERRPLFLRRLLFRFRRHLAAFQLPDHLLPDVGGQPDGIQVHDHFPHPAHVAPELLDEFQYGYQDITPVPIIPEFFPGLVNDLDVLW